MAQQKDIFYLDKVFPNAAGIFSENYKSVHEIISDAVIILDTNILLIPFDAEEKSVSDIKGIYMKYKQEKRLFIPARVAREFANNRATKIGNTFLQLRQLKEKLNSGIFKINKYPILEHHEDYKNIITQFDSIRKSIKEAHKHLENLETTIQNWTWNDSVSAAYKEIFTSDIIIEVQKGTDEIKEDLTFRIEHKVAPGYKDSNKPDDGVGDLVIWQTVLEIARNMNKNVVFVTNDEKNDWFYKQDKIGLYPRYELFDEFRRYTNDKSVAIINFINFLELSNAAKETITEIKTAIVENTIEEPVFYQYTSSDLAKGLQIEHKRYGIGEIIDIKKSSNNPNFDVIKIRFEKHGEKLILPNYSRLRILDTKLNYLIQRDLFNSITTDTQLGYGYADDNIVDSDEK